MKVGTVAKGTETHRLGRTVPAGCGEISPLAGVSLNGSSRSLTARNTIHIDVLVSYSLVADLVGDVITPIVEG